MSQVPLTNWAGNHRYRAASLYAATSVQDVQAFIKAHRHLKVVGTRHCFNDIADTPSHFLSLGQMSKVLALDPTARTVTVEAGITYGQLCPDLHDHGFALHNLASLPHISIAGACATATHGSGVDNKNLAAQVSALQFVTATGDLVNLSRKQDGERFAAAVVHLGALGVVTQLTLDIQPTFAIRQHVYQNLPLSQLIAHFDPIMSAAYSVSLFTDWQNGQIAQLWIKQKIEDPSTPPAPPTFYGATLAPQNLHPVANLSAENCTEQLGIPGPWYDRLPHFRFGFIPSAGKELQSEYFVPRANAADAILAVERLRDHITPHLLIMELRTIAADDLWLSPCYHRPSLAIHFTWKPDWPAVRQVLPLIENALAPFNPRPHWGKLFTLPPAQLQSSYEKLPAFKQLIAEYDPQGKFRNDFLARNL